MLPLSLAFNGWCCSGALVALLLQHTSSARALTQSCFAWPLSLPFFLSPSFSLSLSLTARHTSGLICAAAGTSSLVVDRLTLTPPKVESYFGISRGHIHHIDNSFGFDQRFPYRTPISVRP